MTALDPIPDINQAITSAVNARIEAEVMKALSGDETIGRYVAAALQAKVEVQKGGYRTEQVPFLTDVLRRAIQDATKAAVAKLIAEEMESIEDAVRKSLRRNVAGIADTLTQSLVAASAKPYGVSVDMQLKMPEAGS